MAEARLNPEFKPSAEAYRDLARESIESVAIYNARAQWFEQSGNRRLAEEYRQLSQEALARAQRYQELAERSEKTA